MAVEITLPTRLRRLVYMLADRSDYGSTYREIRHEVACQLIRLSPLHDSSLSSFTIHDINVKPIGSTLDGSGAFLAQV